MGWQLLKVLGSCLQPENLRKRPFEASRSRQVFPTEASQFVEMKRPTEVLQAQEYLFQLP